MTTMNLPMPQDPTFGEQLQAWLYPWLGAPPGWDEMLAAHYPVREPEAGS